MMNKLFTYLKEHYLNHIDRNILSYCICVAIATALWFLNALNKEYVTEISYPVEYSNFPKGKSIVSELPSKITLEIKAKGFTILAYRATTSFLPIVFDINAYTNNQLEKKNVFSYTVNLNELKEKITNQLSSNIKLLQIKPEEIELDFSKASSKNMAVRPVVDYSLKPQYILKNKIKASPDSIMVTGPSSVMDSLQYIETTIWHAGEIEKDMSKEISLQLPSGITSEEKEVKISVQIERFTEAKRTVLLHVLNLPDSLNIRLFPAYVDITYEIGLSMYDKITDADFHFNVNYRKSVGTSFLPVELAGFPSFIQDLTFTPQKIEFILEEK